MVLKGGPGEGDFPSLTESAEGNLPWFRGKEDITSSTVNSNRAQNPTARGSFSVSLNHGPLVFTVFLHWFGSFLETEMMFSKQHGQTSKPLGNC